jgi:hypothetical protein
MRTSIQSTMIHCPLLFIHYKKIKQTHCLIQSSLYQANCTDRFLSSHSVHKTQPTQRLNSLSVGSPVNQSQRVFHCGVGMRKANKDSKIQTKYPNATFLNTTAIYKYVKRFRGTDSVGRPQHNSGLTILWHAWPEWQAARFPALLPQFLYFSCPTSLSIL